MFNQMKQMMEMKKKAEELQAQLATIKVEKSNFFKTVTVRANGAQKLEAVTIDTSLLNAAKKDDLEKALVKVVNDALEEAQKKSASQAAAMMQGLKGLIPGL